MTAGTQAPNARASSINFAQAVLGAAVMTISALLAATPAAAVTVTPVILDLKTGGADMSAVITVDDSFSTPLPVELTTTIAEPNDNGLTDTEKASDDLLIFPPQAIIQPGHTQAFRIQWVGDPSVAKSRHYFVSVAQLPVKLPDTENVVQVLYDFQVIVNVGPAGAKPRLTVAKTAIVKTDSGQFKPVVYISNLSATYGYLSHGHMKVVVDDASGKQITSKTYSDQDIAYLIGPGLVASGQTRPFTLPIDLPTGEGKVDVSFTPEDD